MAFDQSKQLDAVYAKYLVMLRNKIVRINDEKVIELCQQWLSVFNTSPPKHKVSRNYLMSILLEQLQCSKKLSEPFTNLANLEKNLCKVAQEMGLEDENDQMKQRNQRTTFYNSDFASDRERSGEGRNDMSAHCPSPMSTNFTTSSEGDLRITQLDELSKLIMAMKRANECLRSELDQLKEEKEMLEMTNEKQSQEMEELLNVVKSCKDMQTAGEQSEGNAGESEMHVPTTPLAPGVPPTAPSEGQKDCLVGTPISEQRIFDALNCIITNLRGIALADNPLDELRHFQVKTFSQMFETYPNIAFQTKLILYENTIQNLVFQVIQTAKNAFDRKLRCIVDKLTRDRPVDARRVLDDARPMDYKQCQVNLNERATDCRESRSKCAPSECEGSVSDFDNGKQKCIHMKYFRKCLVKMQNHFDQAVLKYENKLQAQKLQNKLRKEVMKLKLISVSHQIFLESSNKTQNEIYQLVNELETQYKHIVSEGDDDEQDCKLSETPKISPTKETPNLECP